MDNSSHGLLGGGGRALYVKVAQTTNNMIALHFISQAIEPYWKNVSPPPQPLAPEYIYRQVGKLLKS